MMDVTKEQVKAILKKTHLSKHYEHCSYIVSQLSGDKPTDLSTGSGATVRKKCSYKCKILLSNTRHLFVKLPQLQLCPVQVLRAS
jgi:hypothetical protein